jgi:anti-anti-sigma regulatory factor
LPDVSYPLVPPAEEVREAEKRPVNALVLTMLALAIASSFGAGALGVRATNARGQGASLRWSVEEDRLGLAASRLGASFLGVFLL